MHHQILRIIDANVNRVSEGLRVLEDIARFVVGDEELSRGFKTTRHRLNKLIEESGVQAIQTRDAEGDVGANFDVTGDHSGLSSITRANARRAQEGIRVLEELSKLPELKALLPSSALKELRYRAYALEKTLVARMAGPPAKGK